jgi:hypothetical protein
MKQLVILLFFLGANQLFGQHVFFGERNLDSLEWIKSPGVCFDKNGWVYPDFFIADSSMRNSNNNLKDFYLSHPAITKQIFHRYNMPKAQVLMGDLTVLNQRIIETNIKRIYKLDQAKISLYIHGYRKSFHEIQNGISSPKEAENLRKFLVESEKTTPMVALYWDGLYDCCFSLKSKKNKQLFRLFEESYKQSVEVGKGMSQFFERIQQKEILVITHSLGSRTYLSCLENIKASNFFTTHSIKSLLVAPATSDLQFLDVINKLKSEPDFYSSKWKVVFNENDFALKKKDSKLGVFGPGFKKYGLTNLGCNKKNALKKMDDKLKLEIPEFSIQLIDASEIGKKHSLFYYTDFLKTKN